MSGMLHDTAYSTTYKAGSFGYRKRHSKTYPISRMVAFYMQTLEVYR